MEKFHIDRFWSRVDKHGPDDCWYWKGGEAGDGYGKYYPPINGEYRAHRIAAMLTNGPIPEEMQVCHQCDNPKCCNPKHLFLGTHQDNVDDKVAKGRQYKGENHHFYGCMKEKNAMYGKTGEKHPTSKLTDKQALEIFSMVGNQYVIADKFNVSQMTVSRIKNKKTFRHLWGE